MGMSFALGHPAHLIKSPFDANEGALFFSFPQAVSLQEALFSRQVKSCGGAWFVLK